MTASSTLPTMVSPTAPPTAPSGASVFVDSQNASPAVTSWDTKMNATTSASRGTVSPVASAPPVGSWSGPQPYAAAPAARATSGSSTIAARLKPSATTSLLHSSLARGTGAASR